MNCVWESPDCARLLESGVFNILRSCSARVAIHTEVEECSETCTIIKKRWCWGGAEVFVCFECRGVFWWVWFCEVFCATGRESGMQGCISFVAAVWGICFFLLLSSNGIALLSWHPWFLVAELQAPLDQLTTPERCNKNVQIRSLLEVLEK